MARNPGAAFAETGYSALLRLSSDDDDLAVCTRSRSEIPRRHQLKLFADASEALKRRLSKEDPRKAAVIVEMVTRAAGHLQSRTREISADFANARTLVQSLDAAGGLDEAALSDFAGSERFARDCQKGGAVLSVA